MQDVRPQDVPVEGGSTNVACRAELSHILEQLEGGARAVVGPWVSEVGFEALYWIPFLRQATASRRIDPAQLTAVSRGGVGCWYDGLCGHYSEIFDVIGVDAFRRSLHERWASAGGQKHMAPDDWDEDLLTRTLSWDPATPVVHPSLMYRALRDGWRGTIAFERLLEQLRFERWPPPHDDGVEQLLPDRYIAAKFYARPSFPDDAEGRALIRRLVAHISEELPVVLLTAELLYDDHDDLDPGVERRVVRFLEDVPAAANLHAQSVAISRAEAFVGTYGGLAYVASAYGVPAVGFASRPEDFMSVHLDVGRHAARTLGTSLTVVDPRTIHTLATAAMVLGQTRS